MSGLQIVRGGGATTVARACGATGLRVEDPKLCGDVVSSALATPGPVVVEAIVDPNEPPMPPKIQPKQALHLGEALARGTPHRGRIAATLLENRVREMV